MVILADTVVTQVKLLPEVCELQISKPVSEDELSVQVRFVEVVDAAATDRPEGVLNKVDALAVAYDEEPIELVDLT